MTWLFQNILVGKSILQACGIRKAYEHIVTRENGLCTNTICTLHALRCSVRWVKLLQGYGYG